MLPCTKLFNKFNTLLIFLLMVLLSACGGDEGSTLTTQTEAKQGVAIPNVLTTALPENGTLSAFIRLDDGARQQMTVGVGYASATLTGITQGEHTITIEFEFAFDSDPGTPIVLASASKVINVGPGQNELKFEETEYEIDRYDEDRDGMPNLTELNNNTNPFAGIAISPISGNTSEGGGAASFSVVLTTEPSADVSIGLSSSDSTEGTINLDVLTFTIGNWDTPQYVIVTGVNDSIADGDMPFDIITAAASSSDVNYNGLASDNVSVINTDNDLAKLQAGPVPIVAVRVGGTATLEGSNSIASGPLTFAWAFTSKPHGSSVELLNPTTATPNFVPDVKGTYMIQLVVTASGITSQRTVTIVEASNEGELFTGPFNHMGLSSNCVNCHNGTLVFSNGDTVVAKSGDHLATTNMCQACHTTFGFASVPFVDHLEVFGNCSECHNGQIAIGKSKFHTPTNAECDDCHNTISFVKLEPDGSFNHAGINRACTTCHNGKVAIGKHENHIATETECGFCHTTVIFQNAYVDHSGTNIVGQACATCHDGTIAIGQSQGHPVTSVDCGICHNVGSFSLNGVFNHSVVDSVSQPCAACHDGVFAKGKNFIVNHVQTDSDCAMCHNTESFTPAFVFDHTGVTNNCAQAGCHGDGATGMHVNHIPIGTLDCSVCHTPGTFSSGVFDHNNLNVEYNPIPPCSTCHNEIISVGKPLYHIETAEECDVCHATDTFAGATVDHTNIFNSCANCHDGYVATGKPVDTHVPTEAAVDCSICHVGGAISLNFIPASSFAHQAETTTQGCQVCHSRIFIASTGNLRAKPRATHIPTQDDCSACHVTTSFAAATFDHSRITRGCEGCHNGRFTTANHTIMGKSSNHIPTDQDCYLCHNTIEDWLLSVQTVFAHVGITGNCVSCHDGRFSGIGALGAPSTAIHTENPNTDCGMCHSTADIPPNGISFLNGLFDHTNFTENCARVGCHDVNSEAGMYAASPAHVQTNADCVLCHIAAGTWTTAVFDHGNISDTQRCDGCHNGIDATGKESQHVPTTRDCRVCHNTTAFAGSKFDHEGITDGCIECHNGETAAGKPNYHVPTNQDCYVCHLTTGFVPARFDHAANQIVDNCAFCHDGGLATSKPTEHVLTTVDCGICHNTRMFSGVSYDHGTIGTQRCDTCHDGITEVGKDAKTNPPHLMTNLDCNSCHTTATFVGGGWIHDASAAGTCLNCHDGSSATGKTPDHFQTESNVQCDYCHTTQSWAPADNYSHDPQGNYPGGHARNPACNACHGNSISIPFQYPNSTFAPFCAACHARDYDAGAHLGTLNDNKDCSGGCHMVTERVW